MLTEATPDGGPAGSGSRDSLKTLCALGRAFLVRCEGPLNGGGPGPLSAVREANGAHARILVVDATCAEYADSDGLRWLLALRSAADEARLELRVAARAGGPVRRNLELLGAGLALYETVQAALHGPAPPFFPVPRKEAGYVG